MSNRDHPEEPEEQGSLYIIPDCTVIVDCPLSADIVLVSSDGHRFGTHLKNLGQFTGGFPVDIVPPNREDIHMPEMDAAALKLFLQYVHHHRQPDLSEVKFETLNQLAEAVEKYDVYSATEIAKTYMKSHIPHHSDDFFLYAYKHGYQKLMNDAARVAIQDKDLRRRISREASHPDLSAAWDRYTRYWIDLFDDCYTEPPPVLHPGGVKSCKKWGRFSHAVRSGATSELSTFARWEGIVNSARHYIADCRHCNIRADHWMSNAMWKVGNAEGLESFTSYL